MGNEQLRRESRRKDEFLAILSHELRNPLASVQAGLDVMQTLTQDNHQLHAAHAIMARQVDHLSRLVDDLLDVSRISHGKIALHSSCFDFRDAVTQAIEALGQAARRIHEILGDQAPRLIAMTGYGSTRDRERTRAAEFDAHLVKPAAAAELRRALENAGSLITQVPHDYIAISSALGQATPLNIVVVPILFEGEAKGVIELASFVDFTPTQIAFIDQLLESLGIVIATIEATMRTDELLRQSQAMAQQLQAHQQELQQTNEELEHKAQQLTTQRDEVEHKNRAVELAKQELEEKAEQLSLTSKYKSQFVANLSHKLRTPLNSLLILSKKVDQPRDRAPAGRRVAGGERAGKRQHVPTLPAPGLPATAAQ